MVDLRKLMEKAEEEMKRQSVTLSGVQCRWADSVGRARYTESRRLGLNKAKYGAPAGEDLERDIQGAAAELAFAEFMGWEWPASVNAWDRPDFPPRIEIRHTKLQCGRLIVRPDADPLAIYVLVVGEMPTFRVIGWIRAEHAMKDVYKEDPNHRGWAWFVPQDKLEPVEKPAPKPPLPGPSAGA
jgi:hypothetical protein